MTSITAKAGIQRSTIRVKLDMYTIKPQINEVFLKRENDWLYFTNPQRLIVAHTLSEVLPALREIEDQVEKNGWHAAGFISYEAAPAFDPAHTTKLVTGFPYLWFGLYPSPRLISKPKPDSVKPTLNWLPLTDRDTYNAAIEQIKSRIAEGQTYQVNYTMLLQAEFHTDPWNFFLHITQGQSDHAAYVDTGRYVIASASPELFFRLEGDTIIGRPMKGTVRRGRTPLEDREQAQWLRNSEKNRAENVMIVDMIRNDLGRIAKTGSVSVPELFTIEKYPTLWQMTSTITAQTGASLGQIFTALFPCASITGAPKVSTTKIISELEISPRKIYTGSIGYIEPNRKATFNVAIRTALINRESRSAEYGVGGGVIWDSTSIDEYAEALLKARVLTEETPRFSLLETMLWTPEEGFFLREKHIERLLASADYFDFFVSKEKVEEKLNRTGSSFKFPQRIRLLAGQQGDITIENKPFQAEDRPLRICLANTPVNSNDIFLFHKTTHRFVYETAKKFYPDCDDVLLFNERGELTEFTIGNLVVEMDGNLFTPPVSCGLLPGTFRSHLLETAQVEERTVQVGELQRCTKVFLVNSVRKWQRVEIR
ncbi:MAG: aminodeoxychorismate synthase component I [Chloroflexi bacterium]|nr:aminodeoxychorismate synthase component I [Chloroflexota bacterium]